MAKSKAPKKLSATSLILDNEPHQVYTVLARRHRPQVFSELVGQEAVAQALSNAILSGRVAHAYLFTGARGVGKTSAARILAKALNCVKGPTPVPCNQCEICQSITSGEDVDVIEIDGASNRGIDNVRELRGNVQYRPSRARFKIYIIDEVHMLSREAFNALLKTLEEPPEHVKFIFATTEVQKIPITVLSRCQRFDFGTITPSRIVERLKSIVASEGLDADEEALAIISKRAAGSMRDSQSILDQLLAFGDKKLSVDRVHELLGTANEDRILDLAGAILKGDSAQALAHIAAACEKGLSLGEFTDQLIDYWRDLLLLRCAGDQAPDLTISSQSRDKAKVHAAKLSVDTLLAGLEILNNAKGRLRFSNHGRVALEMAAVRLARIEDLVPLPQLAQLAAQGGSGALITEPATKPTELRESVKKNFLIAPEIGSKPREDQSQPNGSMPLNEADMQDLWDQVARQVGPILGAQLLSGPLPAISGPNSLVIRLNSGYNPMSEGKFEESRIERIREALRKITGQSFQLRIEANTNQETGPSPEAPSVGESPMSRRRNLRAEALHNPFLKHVLETLDAQVLQMEEGFGGTAAPAVSLESAGEETEE